MVKSFRLLLLLMLCVMSMDRLVTQTVDHSTTGSQYETLRMRFAENLRFANPFDLESNRVDLVILRPDQSRQVLSFFYDGTNANGVEQWEARFAPREAGLHRFSVVINGTVRERFEVSVKAHRPQSEGGLRIAGRPGLFIHESGKPFRGIGLNVCWANDYEYYFKKMQSAGMNVARIWMCPWNLSFEWKETGLGRYSLETARRLDSILKLAEQYGIYVLLCMDYHGIAPKGLGFFREDRWLANPYNKANGGPCVDAGDLYTNPEAKQLFRRKYKYIVSRFGHSPALATWEFMNEADLMAGKSLPVNRWHVEMAEYIKSIDVHGRLVSSSSTRKYMEKLVDAFKSPAMDYVMFHDYNSLNLAPHFTDFHDATVEYYQKPVVLGEFGIEFRGGDRTYKEDPQHIGLHNGIWSGWFSETPVIPMSWWWDNYIDDYDLWPEYAALSRFGSSMNLDVDHLTYKTLQPGRMHADPSEQAPSMVRCIYDGENCALWFKNLDYQWSLVAEGTVLKEVGAFSQPVPELAPGRYTISWYEPQGGHFFEKTVDVVVKEDGILTLTVPAFLKDLACVVTKR